MGLRTSDKYTWTDRSHKQTSTVSKLTSDTSLGRVSTVSKLTPTYTELKSRN